MPRAKNNHLTICTLRLFKKDLALARRIARARAIPYQHVVRSWVSEAAARAEASTRRSR